MLQSRLWSKGDAGNIMLIADRIDLHVLVLSHKMRLYCTLRVF